MSEYQYVEKPFLTQLEALGWDIIDQGEGIPGNPAESLRTDFREVALKETFKKSVRSINLTEDSREWLTDYQLEDLYDELIGQPGKSLIEVNISVLESLYKITVDLNELTGEEYPVVKLIEFHKWERNHFVAINQFRIDTPGRVKDHIRPDIVLFVNGLPLVVVECKDANIYTSDPMTEAVKQLRRYSDQREETIEAGLKEGEERLFHFNQLIIATTGEVAKFGTITATGKYFFEWKSIMPKKYQVYNPPLGKERSQERLIQGMLAPETLLDIVRNFTIFMNVGSSLVKVVARYQQYRAVLKILDRMKTGKTSDERSGVIWHTQGSGKSLTMVFLVRKIRRCEELKDFKILMVNDRIYLEKQLGETVALTGEKIYYISSSEQLKKDLTGDSSNLSMVMAHKFREAQMNNLPAYVAEAIASTRKPVGTQSPIAEYKLFGEVNQVRPDTNSC